MAGASADMALEGEDFRQAEQRWDGRAEVYEMSAPCHARDIQMMLDLVAVYCPAPRSLLDLGCGTGQLLIEAYRKFRVSGQGLDASQAMMTKARVSFRMQLPAAALPPPRYGDITDEATLRAFGGPWDVLTCLWTASHLPKAHIVDTFAMWGRHLTPGTGVLVVEWGVPILGCVESFDGRSRTYGPAHLMTDQLEMDYLKRDIEKLLGRAGMELVEFKPRHLGHPDCPTQAVLGRITADARQRWAGMSVAQQHRPEYRIRAGDSREDRFIGFRNIMKVEWLEGMQQDPTQPLLGVPLWMYKGVCISALIVARPIAAGAPTSTGQAISAPGATSGPGGKGKKGKKEGGAKA